MAAALAAAAAGWAIFPLAPREKIPANGHGFKEATTDASIIRSWWFKWPDANIGLATGQRSGLFVLDLDGQEGEDSLASLIYGYGHLSYFDEVDTAEATTGKGRHIYYQANQPIRSRTRLWPGLDVRADGGYVVMPPSIHPNGRRYEWVDRWRIVTTPNDWLVDLINDTFPGGKAARSQVARPASTFDPTDTDPTDDHRLRAAKNTIRNMARLEPGQREAGTFNHGCGLRRMARTEQEWESWVAEVLEVLPYGPDPTGGKLFTHEEARRALACAPRYAQLGTWRPKRSTPDAINRRWTMHREERDT